MRSLLSGSLFLSLAMVASADAIYDVTINTQSISGTVGLLDFNFNPGPLTTQAASLQILNFMPGGSLVDCASNSQGFCTTGDVSGTLPATLTFDNGPSFNDYFDGLTFSDSLSFDVRLYGPAIDSPDGVSTSGSTFAFSMFSNGQGTMPVLTSDSTDGFAATISVNVDGTTTVSNFSPAATIGAPSAVPESNGLTLIYIDPFDCVREGRWRTDDKAFYERMY
jgi:hypothetical protein